MGAADPHGAGLFTKMGFEKAGRRGLSLPHKPLNCTVSSSSLLRHRPAAGFGRVLFALARPCADKARIPELIPRAFPWSLLSGVCVGSKRRLKLRLRELSCRLFVRAPPALSQPPGKHVFSSPHHPT